jgi:hypothetical protein
MPTTGLVTPYTINSRAMRLDTVNLTHTDGAATIELNRPDALNAWN